MKRLLLLAPLVALVLVDLSPATASPTSSRVIVSTTLNDTLQFFDAAALTQTQPPLPSKGLGPVRLSLYEDAGNQYEGAPDAGYRDRYLFAANHGLALGSVGVFDISGALVTELPASPFPARTGSVAITAGRMMGADLNTKPVVLVTNTYQALAGCGVPSGSVTVYDAGVPLALRGVLTEIATHEVSGAQPWGVALDPFVFPSAGNSHSAFVSTNCGDSLDTIRLDSSTCSFLGCFGGTTSHQGTRPAGDGPDATLFDPVHRLILTVNIAGNAVTVHRPTGPIATTVPLPGAGPIDATLAQGPNGERWLITANGRDDTISIVDRDAIAACVAASAATCPGAQVGRIATGVPGGAPEGVAFDPVTQRAFVVNKTFPPSLTAIALVPSGGTVTGTPVGTIPLNAAGTDVPIPAAIAFDVVVQVR